MNRTAEHLYNAFILNETFYHDNLISENNSETQRVLDMIDDDDNWERNDYDNFTKSVELTKLPGFLTHYTPEELRDNNVQTFKLKGYPIGFGLKPAEDGNIDIVSLHNNANDRGVHGIVNSLLKKAVKHGGNQLDHFDGILSDFYGDNGFEEYDRTDWDDKYAPKDWEYDKYGKPPVIFRRKPNKLVNEMLNLIYRMR